MFPVIRPGVSEGHVVNHKGRETGLPNHESRGQRVSYLADEGEKSHLSFLDCICRLEHGPGQETGFVVRVLKWELEGDGEGEEESENYHSHAGLYI